MACLFLESNSIFYGHIFQTKVKGLFIYTSESHRIGRSPTSNAELDFCRICISLCRCFCYHMINCTLSSSIQVTGSLLERNEISPQILLFHPGLWVKDRHAYHYTLVLNLFYYFKAMMMSLLHLHRVAMFCIPTWSLRKWYGMACYINVFLEKVQQ